MGNDINVNNKHGYPKSKNVMSNLNIHLVQGREKETQTFDGQFELF